MGKEPEVSVVLPIYQGEAFLREAIESVLAQTWQSFELLLIDDGSEDGSADIARELAQADHRLHYRRQENRGVTQARNRGIEESRGSLIAFIDQDDRWLPDALERHVRGHAEHVSAGYSVGWQRCFLEPGAPVPSWFGRQQLDRPAVAHLPGTLAVKRDTFRVLGAFDPRYPISSDADWFARARDAGVEELRVEAVLLERRIHSANQSRHAERIHGELFDVLRASLRRKRGGRDHS